MKVDENVGDSFPEIWSRREFLICQKRFSTLVLGCVKQRNPGISQHFDTSEKFCRPNAGRRSDHPSL